jgi:regulator of protease activity HflC (stomatin/prohibitin superfamily)
VPQGTEAEAHQRRQVIDIADTFEVPAGVAARLLQLQARQRPALPPPGLHAFWQFSRKVAVELVDLRLQTLEVTGQEILTRDKVALRLNLSAVWRYTDVLTAYRELAKPADHLYRELQFGLRAAVGTRSLDELLENKSVIDELVTAQVSQRLAAYGLALEGVGVKDIVLPGEMKTILAQVVEAGKSAEANVIRRRKESAATRSLLNAAR